MKSQWAETFQELKITPYFLHENNGKNEEDILDSCHKNKM